MAISSIQQVNMLQIQQVSSSQASGRDKADTHADRNGGKGTAVDTAGNAADQLAQEVQTVKKVTDTAAYNQGGKDHESEDSAARKSQAEMMERIAERLDEQKQNNDEIRKAVEEINKKMIANTEAVFGIHDKTNRVTIKIVDKDSKKVIKEFPPEKTLDMIAKAWELAGIMVDTRK
jgi:flagellar protein FlaG